MQVKSHAVHLPFSTHVSNREARATRGHSKGSKWEIQCRALRTLLPWYVRLEAAAVYVLPRSETCALDQIRPCSGPQQCEDAGSGRSRRVPDLPTRVGIRRTPPTPRMCSPKSLPGRRSRPNALAPPDRITPSDLSVSRPSNRASRILCTGSNSNRNPIWSLRQNPQPLVTGTLPSCLDWVLRTDFQTETDPEPQATLARLDTSSRDQRHRSA